MECNKDEALRAKEIAERKLIEKDIIGSKKFALKARNLYPGLEGLSQFEATLDVYFNAEKRICGELDWYGILGADPLADQETTRKCYRKLALTLHPDKNKSVGAEGAFKILSEAWSMLSDKAKKQAYDQKRRTFLYQKVATQNPSSTSAGNNGFHHSMKNNTVGVDHQKMPSNPQSTQTYPYPPRINSFWTSCSKCRMNYEYSNEFLNKKLLCPNCRQAFWAFELLQLPKKPNPTAPWPLNNQHQKTNHQSVNKSSTGFGGLASTTNVNAQQGSSSNLLTLKRPKAQASNSGLECNIADGFSKKRYIDEQKGSGMRKDAQKFTMGHNVSSGGDRLSVSRRSKGSAMREDVPQSQVRPLLMTKAKMGILKKLDEWIETKDVSSHKEAGKHKKEKVDAVGTNVQDVKENGMRREREMNGSYENVKNTTRLKDSPQPPEDSMDSNEKATEVMLMSVPDPDFHNFDNDRTEKSFAENQVWAAYDDEDGMPRYYAIVHSVMSKRQFKIRISWLNSKSNSEFSPMNWVSCGFPKTNGEFRIGKHEINTTLNAFSHKVNWSKGKKGVIQIFPQKGEVWALYKNWSVEWSEVTPDEVVQKYEMVIVIENYKEEQGVIVAPLVKVAGFKSVFRQLFDERGVRTIPKEEIFRFSHQVPSYSLTGQEAGNAPNGCWELDPAALPLDLLQVISESEEIENVSKVLNASCNSKKVMEKKEIITYSRRTKRKSL